MGVRFDAESSYESILMHVHQQLVLSVISDCKIENDARVLDIGTHNGQFAACLLAVRPDLRVTSLEPNPTTFSIASRNAEIRRDTGLQWNVLPVGLDIETRSRCFYFVHGRSGQGSLYRDNATRNLVGPKHLVETTVEFVNGEELRRRLGVGHECWGLIKIDVEGHEVALVPEIAALEFEYLLVEVGIGRTGGASPEKMKAAFRENGVELVEISRYGPKSSDVLDVLFKVRHPRPRTA